MKDGWRRGNAPSEVAYTAGILRAFAILFGDGVLVREEAPEASALPSSKAAEQARQCSEEAPNE
jgi:hypothetical protein